MPSVCQTDPLLQLLETNSGAALNVKVMGENSNFNWMKKKSEQQTKILNSQNSQCMQRLSAREIFTSCHVMLVGPLQRGSLSRSCCGITVPLAFAYVVLCLPAPQL